MTEPEGQEGPDEADEGEGDTLEESDGVPIPWTRVLGLLLAVGLAIGVYLAVQRYRAHGAIAEAERLIAAGKYAEASARLDAAVSAGDAGDAFLLKMKADFLRGHWQEADALAERNAGRTFKGAQAAEVNAISQRVHAALRLATEAKGLYEKGDLDKAEAEMAEATGLYPESADLRDSLENIRGNAAFQKKDYARFLEIAEEGVRRGPESPSSAALLASALSARYAETGEEAYKQRAETALENARRLSEGSPAAKALYDEYSERIRHRLQSREILSRAEYDRRFRAKAAPTSAPH